MLKKFTNIEVALYFPQPKRTKVKMEGNAPAAHHNRTAAIGYNASSSLSSSSSSSASSLGDILMEEVEEGGFHYWIEGVAVTTVSAVGLVCNAIAVAVLVRPRMRGSFHALLVIRITTVDILSWT